MVVDTGPVLAALGAAGVAVASVGLSVLLVAVTVGIYRNLRFIFSSDYRADWYRREAEEQDRADDRRHGY